MKAIIIVVCAIVISSEAHSRFGQFQQKSCQPSDYNLHFYDCTDTLQVKVLGVEFLVYPLDMHQPINLTITLNNTGGIITSMRQNIFVEWYGLVLFTCGWNQLFVNRNVDGCSELGNCPQQPGLVVTHVNIDTAPYEGVIDLLPFDRIYLRFTIQSYDQNGKFVSCVVVTGLACKHGTDC